LIYIVDDKLCDIDKALAEDYCARGMLTRHSRRYYIVVKCKT